MDSTATTATTTARLVAITVIAAPLAGQSFSSKEEMLKKLSAENTGRKVQTDVKKVRRNLHRRKKNHDKFKIVLRRVQSSLCALGHEMIAHFAAVFIHVQCAVSTELARWFILLDLAG